MLARMHYAATRRLYLDRADNARGERLLALMQGDEYAAAHYLGELLDAQVRLALARQHYYGPRRNAA